jgi:hypothetical protein
VIRHALAAISLLVLASSPAAAQPAARDISLQFARFGPPTALDEAAIRTAFTQVQPQLAGMTIVIVPSWLSGPLLDLRAIGMSDYFLAIENDLSKAGARVVTADVNTAAGVATNGPRIRRLLRETDGPICLLTHSKGGLDALEALIGADDSVVRKVRCWVALQAPFYGSPLADTADAPVLGTVGAFLLTLASGDGNSLSDLRTDLRARYMQEHAKAVAATVARVRIVCVTSYFDGSDPRFPHPPQLQATRYLMERRGQRNDSLVPTDSAILPGCPYIVLPNIDHTDTISGRLIGPSPLDPGLLVRALFTIALAG